MAGLLLCLSFAAHAQIEASVENGTEVGATEKLRLSVAEVRWPGGKCSASFISDITLLTAGHCIHGSSGSVTVRIRDSQGRFHEERVKSILRHPNYKMESVPTGMRVANDFGLIKLRRKFPIAIRPLRIVDVRSARGEFPVLVLGYGKISETRSSGVLRRGRMTAEVQPIYGFYDELGLGMIAADSNLNATCPGDSGGPVVLEDSALRSLVGVHSLSSGCQGEQPAHSLSALPVLVSRWIWANFE